MISCENVIIKAAILKETRTFLEGSGFIEVFPSRIGNLSAACEDISTLFPVDYYGQEVFLSQTAQPFLEEYIQHFNKVYCFTPCFRKETEADDRHLSEFWHLEVEWRTQDLSEIEEFIETYIRYLIQNIPKLHRVHFPFKRVEFGQQSEIITTPRFVEHFPAENKWFNFKKNANPNLTESADLDVPYVGEIVGLGVRSSDACELQQRLNKQMKELGLLHKASDFSKYIGMKQTATYGSGGFGVGLERLMMFLLGINRIQDTGDSASFVRDYSTKI